MASLWVGIAYLVQLAMPGMFRIFADHSFIHLFIYPSIDPFLEYTQDVTKEFMAICIAWEAQIGII